MTRPMPELFHPPSPEGFGATGGLEWGTKNVLAQTLAAATCKPILLPELDDVDLPEDIPPKISVIIPTLNEEKTLFQTLEKVREGFDTEFIIADGGSTDQTELIAGIPHFMKCGNIGRAAQMNAGAAAASGEILLFLHADTELPDNWDFLIRSALKNQQVALGAFRFEVKERLRGIGWVERGTNIRSKFFRMPYGDQGLFLRREMFEKIGGFAEQPILEDVELVKAARKFGKIITLAEPAITSGRRWQQLGVLRTTVRNQLILLGAALGVSPQRLRMVYTEGV
jgi:rSAM/selenodomain-associated transferase 2